MNAFVLINEMNVFRLFEGASIPCSRLKPGTIDQIVEAPDKSEYHWLIIWPSMVTCEALVLFLLSSNGSCCALVSC